MARTGAQLLAVAVGNVHGKYKGEPQLRWDVLQDIAVRTHIPLVLHGASGIPAEELVKAAAMNVGKVNFNTELRTGVLATSRNRLPAHRADGENLQALLGLWNASARTFAATALATLSRWTTVTAERQSRPCSQARIRAILLWPPRAPPAPTMDGTTAVRFPRGAMACHSSGPAGDPAPMPDRDPVIDLARFFCLALVVVGHTMMVSPVLHPDGTVTSENTLGDQHWFEPVVWVLQIMPLFFVAGGITGLQSWRRLRARGGNAFDFMQARLLRLIRPAAVLLAVMFAGLSAARLAGVDPQVIELLTSGAGMPLWFLAAYLAAQLNLPLAGGPPRPRAMADLRRPHRAGGGGRLPARECCRCWPTLNMVFLWCAVQQLGFIVADGRAAGRAVRRWWASSSPATCCSGCSSVLGLYSGNMLVNLNPPNLTLLLLGVSQAAALQLFRPVLSRIASVAWVRTVVAVAGRRSMTVYLWHLPLLAAMSGLLLLTDFPQPAGGTAAWWWGRPLVLLGVIALLLPVLALFGRLEERPTASGHVARPAGGRRGDWPPSSSLSRWPTPRSTGSRWGSSAGAPPASRSPSLLLGRIPVRLTPPPDGQGGSEPPLPRPPLSANVEP